MLSRLKRHLPVRPKDDQLGSEPNKQFFESASTGSKSGEQETFENNGISPSDGFGSRTRKEYGLIELFNPNGTTNTVAE